jgi:hypothetical protein
LLNRLREAMFGVGRRVSAVGSGFVDTFLRDNRVIPIVLALLALLVFAWIVADAFLGGGPAKEPVSNRAEVAQAQNPPTSDPPAPEVENPDVDTYAAYQFKDPFRQLFAPAGSTTPTTTPTTTPEETTGGAGGGGGGGGGGAGGGLDTDGDGLSDEREARLGLNPANPDTDGDGTLDGQEEEARGGNGGAGGGGGRGGGGLPGSGGPKGALPESGGEIPLQ